MAREFLVIERRQFLKLIKVDREHAIENGFARSLQQLCQSFFRQSFLVWPEQLDAAVASWSRTVA